MKYIYKLIILFTLVYSPNLFAQVNIGSLNSPAQGALLQVKEHEPTNPLVDNETVSTGGMVLPRVQLVGESSLAPFIDPASADYEVQKLLHAGLMVYSITNNGAFLVPGVYIWDGAKWRGASIKSSDFWLTLSTNYLNFSSGVATGVVSPESVTIEWEPAGSFCAIKVTPIQRGGVKVKNLPAITNSTGNHVLAIELEPFTLAEVTADPFLEKASQITVTANDGSGEVKEEFLELKQTHYALVISDFEGDGRMGALRTIKIASNTNWQVEVNDPNNIIASYAPALGGNNINGENFTYEIVNDDTKQGKTATLTFKHPTGAYAPQVFTITAVKEFPNSYIVVPNSTFEFPVRKAYTAWENYLGETLSGSLEATLLWQDATSLVTDVQLADGDKGILSKIKVTVGDKVGNATINLAVGGKTVWTWHLWITDYDPNLGQPIFAEGDSGSTEVGNGKLWTYYNGRKTSTFMDRYLGADTDDYTQTGSKGLVYQWGRHVPFTNQDAFIGNISRRYARKIYNIDNVQYTTEDDGFTAGDVPTDVENNVANALQNPMTFYKAALSNDNDWYSAKIGVVDDYLWSTVEGKKAIFDPCPEGWRIPTSGNGTESPWYGLINKNMDETIPLVAYVNGGDFRNQGAGVYPNAGARNGADANFSFYGVGLPWSSSAVDASSLTIYRGNAAYNPFYIIPRATAGSVRCVKDK